MKISASSSSSSSTFRTCLLFLARERPLSGLLFFLSVLFDVGLSCYHSSSSSTGLDRDLVLFLGLASGWSSSSSVWGSTVMPLTSKDVRRLLEVEPLSVEVNGTGTRLLDVDGPADDSPLLGFGCARVLRDLLGRCCWVSLSSSCKYAAEYQSFVVRLTMRRLIKIWSMRYFIMFLNVGSALNFSAVGARTPRSVAMH